jgi:hypothetical protein
LRPGGCKLKLGPGGEVAIPGIQGALDPN